MQPNHRLRFGLALLLALFAWGLVALMNLAISRAPIYGDHSTLRADPMGAKALYETFAAIPGLRVERHMRRAARLAGVDATVFWIGTQPWAPLAWDKDDLAAFEAIAQRGGRLVLGVLPSGPAALGDPVQAEAKPAAKAPRPRVVEIEKRWHLRVERERSKKSKGASSQEEPEEESPRHTSLWLEPLTAEWHCFQTVERRCRAAERTFGAGAIVIALDTFPLSNEGLSKDRQSAWIAQLAGPAQRIIFDEAHLGVQESGSIGTLIRQLRLEAAALMLVALAALFIWRNSTSLLPARAPAPDLGLAADPHRSMVLLLRRSIAPAALIKTCLAEWQRAEALLPYRHRRRIAQALASVDANARATAAWKSIRQTLLEKS